MKIPRLDKAGKNWVIYKAHFLWSIDAHRKLEHVDGTAVAPANPITQTLGHTLSSARFVAKLLHTKSGKPLGGISKTSPGWYPWTCIEGSSRSAAPTKGMSMLIFASFPPTKDNFYAIVMGSLPSSYDPYISAINATSSVMGTTLSADNFMHTVTEEFVRHTLNFQGTKKEENLVFYFNNAGRGRKGAHASLGSKKNIEGQRKGWAGSKGPKSKGKAKDAGSGDRGKGKETAASARAKSLDEEEEGSWMAIAALDNNYNMISDGYFSSASSHALSNEDILDLFASESDGKSDMYTDLPDLMQVPDLDNKSLPKPDGDVQ
ncbi:hypothetical protein B0H34DRAFT_671601 [Crassisporium funariophilum]|nr:hypothetical protein B0H34DRAFT_671601 [Crassisporium funariophilum]